MVVGGVTSFWRLEDVTNTCKRLRISPTFGGIFQCNGGKMEESEYFKCGFVVYCFFESGV